MNRQEAIKICMILDVAFPRYKDIGKDELELKVGLWQTAFKDDEFGIVEMAVQKYIFTGERPPMISDIKRNIAEIRIGKVKSSHEAWQEVMEFVSDFGGYASQENFMRLDSLTMKVVKTIGYDHICRSDGDGLSVLMSQFVRSYETMVKRDQQDMMLPEWFKEKAKEIGSKVGKVKELGGGD